MFVNQIINGMNLKENVFLLKKIGTFKSKHDKDYLSLTLMDKTGELDGKVWEPADPMIEEVSEGDYVVVSGRVNDYNGRPQANIKELRKASEGTFDESDFIPTTRFDTEKMYSKLLKLVDSIKAPYMKELLESFFVKDEAFIKNFKKHSAAKSVHHGFSGGLLEHTLSVAELCSDLAAHYDYLDRDLLVTAGLCHDIGKVEELSGFPQNIYTDEGQLLGHIVIGTWMVRDHIADIPDFPEKKKNELLHCILSHHGKLEYGSPKVPMLVEAEALQFADNIDAKMETFREALEGGIPDSTGWMGYNRFLEANFRKTTDD